MGYMASWVGVHGRQRAEVLEALGFVETGELVEPGSGESKWSVGEVDNGWLIIYSEDFDWGTPKRVLEASALGPATGLQFEDKVEMTSIACAAKDGVELWRVSHVNSDEEGEALEVTGDPPPAFVGIRDRLLQKQAEADGDSVDYLHDIPIEVAKSVCGYRADDWEPPFAALRRIGETAESKPAAATAGGGLFGLLRGLLGGRR